MSKYRQIPMDLLAALEAAHNGDGDLREAAAPIVAMLHGNRSAYARGCRCAECTAANTEYQRTKTNVRLAAKLAADPDCVPHGTDSTYSNYGCRCEPCTAAATEANRKRRQARKAAAMT